MCVVEFRPIARDDARSGWEGAAAEGLPGGAESREGSRRRCRCCFHRAKMPARGPVVVLGRGSPASSTGAPLRVFCSLFFNDGL